MLFKNQRKSEKCWGKRWKFKKRIAEQFRKTVENECVGKISHFLINVPKPTENLRKCLKKFWRNFWESLRKLLRKSKKYFYQGYYYTLFFSSRITNQKSHNLSYAQSQTFFDDVVIASCLSQFSIFYSCHYQSFPTPVNFKPSLNHFFVNLFPFAGNHPC